MLLNVFGNDKYIVDGVAFLAFKVDVRKSVRIIVDAAVAKVQSGNQMAFLKSLQRIVNRRAGKSWNFGMQSFVNRIDCRVIFLRMQII